MRSHCAFLIVVFVALPRHLRGFTDRPGIELSLEMYADVPEWVTHASAPHYGQLGASVVVSDHVVVVGYNSVAIYDLEADRWAQAPPLPTPRAALCAARMSAATLVAVGGTDGGHYKRSTEELNLEDLTWRTVAAMPTHRAMASSASLYHTVWTVAGYDGRTDLAALERLTVDGRWTTLAAAPTARCNAAGELSHGRALVLLGGLSAARTVDRLLEVYTVAADGWTTAVPSPSSRRSVFSALAATGALVFAMGGKRKGAAVLEVFNGGNEVWTTLGSQGLPATAGCSLLLVPGDRLFWLSAGQPLHTRSADIQSPLAMAAVNVLPLSNVLIAVPDGLRTMPLEAHSGPLTSPQPPTLPVVVIVVIGLSALCSLALGAAVFVYARRWRRARLAVAPAPLYSPSRAWTGAVTPAASTTAAAAPRK